MTSEEPVSEWIFALKKGDHEAINRLWNHYYTQIMHVALRKLRGSKRRVADEEDVASLALESFFDRAQKNEFPKLENRQDLWALLVTITERKAYNQMRDANRLKRGGGQVRGDSVFIKARDLDASPGADSLPSDEMAPDLKAVVTENFEYLLRALNAQERAVAWGKFGGGTNKEISDDLGVSERTVERHLKKIREKWTELGKGVQPPSTFSPE